MANYENSSTPLNEGHQPPHQPLMRMSPGDEPRMPGGEMLVTAPYASPNFSRTPHVVNGGLDAQWFFHSLRRRWLLATCMGLLLGSVAAGVLYWLFPESDTAIARFQVRAEPTSIMYKNLDPANQNYEIFRATQIALLKSNTVLQAMLLDPALQSVEELQNAEDQITWLAENLNVQFEGKSELLSISLSLKAPSEDLEAVVNAACEAYKEEVVLKDKFSRTKIKDALAATHAQLNEEIRDKWDEYRDIAVSLDTGEQGKFDPKVQLLFAEIKGKMDARAKIQQEMRDMQLQFIIWKNQHDNPALKKELIDLQVESSQELQIMDQQMIGIRMQMRDAQQRARNQRTREVRRLEDQLTSLQRSRAQLENELKQQIQTAIDNEPDIELGMVYQQYQLRMQMGLAQLKELQSGRDIEKEDGSVEHVNGIEDIEKELKAKAIESTDLLIRKAELDGLQEVANDLSRRIESWNIELNADPRVQLVERAFTVPGINRLQQYLIAGLGGLATLLLTCVGIAYLEFLGRRLNGPSQLDEGLGLRVVGTLPALNAKRLMNPNHPLVAQLTESIDSVRTALMHDSTSKPRKVVLVTSPSAMEGRTTVASQLAASLARAGRRTLLIDGDLRRPALHSLFDVPLEDGLCEVLRAETEVGDVVRPTHAEGLWLMTAGYCDADAVHAMATDQIQPVFDKLRADYDFVIIDGAPVLGLSDSLMVGQHCDGALLSVLRDHTSVPKIHQAAELLRSVGVRMIGSVVNGVTEKADRRVTHLQGAGAKASRKQLETAASEE